MRIDSHQHFWDIARFRYAWMAEDSPLHRSYLPEHFAPILQRNRFDASIVVQANVIPDETRWLLDLASAHDFIAGVVGWADLTDPALPHLLDEFQRHPKFKGIRHLVQDEPDVNWLLRPEVLRGLAELARRGIPYDLLLRPPHLRLVPELAARVPGLRMVIDHIAKPRIAERLMEGWAEDMEAAAHVPGLCCKLSGMITEAGPGWKAGDLRPYVQHVLHLFGPERLMFGSDWPVCTLAAGKWKEVLAAFTQAVGPMTVEKREHLLGATAARFYGLP